MTESDKVKALLGLSIPATVDGSFYDYVKLNSGSVEAILNALEAAEAQTKGNQS